MKTASSATKTILASGQFIKYELYKFSPVLGSPLYLSNAEIPLTVAGQLYSGGLNIVRGDITFSSDLSVDTMELTIAPQPDYPGGPPLINGLPFLTAVRQGLLDGTFVTMYKLFLALPDQVSPWPDTSPGTVPWFTGLVSDASAGRLMAKLNIHLTTELLNLQMPRNLVSTGCTHVLYDAGCTLSKATFQVSGTVAAGSGVLSINTNLTQVNNYFDLGVIKFTSGVNNGYSRTVRTYLNASGNVSLLLPLAVAPSPGDTFTILPGCKKTQAQCSNNSSASGPPFNNIAHFRGAPFVPVPETIAEGGTSSPPTNYTPLGPPSGPGSGGRFKYQP